MANEKEYKEQDDPFDNLEVPEETSNAHKVVKEFISEEGIEGKTVLSAKQIAAFTKLDIFHNDFPEYGVDRLKKFLLLKISEKGQSRKGLLEMLKGNVQLEEHKDGHDLKRGNY